MKGTVEEVRDNCSLEVNRIAENTFEEGDSKSTNTKD
jgi:hypothetical protein